MTIVKIELPDEHAATLSAQASAQGLTLGALLQKFAGEEASSATLLYGHPEGYAAAVEKILLLQESVKPDPDASGTRDYAHSTT